MLENFLLDFPGNLLVVSHDRYFMDKIMDSLFVFRGNGVVENFPGNYSDFRAYEDSKPKEKKTDTLVSEKEGHKSSFKTKREALSFNENREFGLLETDIAKLENKKIKIEHQFANNEISPEDINKKSQELQQIISRFRTKRRTLVRAFYEIRRLIKLLLYEILLLILHY